MLLVKMACFPSATAHMFYTGPNLRDTKKCSAYKGIGKGTKCIQNTEYFTK